MSIPTKSSQATARKTARETDVVLRLAGESGEGVVSLGDLAVRMFATMGLDIYTYQTFPAEIKGGTVMYQIRVRSGLTLSQGNHPDVMIVLSEEGYELFGQEIAEQGFLLYDADVFTPDPQPGRTDIALAISTLAKAEKEAVKHDVDPEQLKRLPAPKNIVALGALLRLVNAPLEPAEQYVRDLFGRKGEAITRMNLRALHTGAEAVESQLGAKPTPRIFPAESTGDKLIINGNQMLAMGAIAAGMRFYAGYPITPASEIMEFFAKELPAFGGDVIQAEDEMAALGMVVGASYAGKKAMTATSGPGVSLMTELIGLAAQAEIPIVVADIQRGGASTGMPTKTSQGDLNLALFGVHNESPRIVLAATSVEDCFWTTIEAFNLAEAYQCPVILLSDQALATRKCTVPPPDIEAVDVVNRLAPTSDDLRDGYLRYKDTKTGVSPMSTPGLPGALYVATGIEHDEAGDPGYTPELAARMKTKRYRKFETLSTVQSSAYVRERGDDGQVDVGVIAFGSTEGVIREAVERAQIDGYKVAHQQVRLLNPLPIAAIKAFAARCGKILVPELNFTGQFAGWLRRHVDFPIHTYHKDEGIPFVASEIYRQITSLADTKN
ncbi:MAG TPA: 2-oxoacid:acceptor oxidoreductase subunit alpha [Capsulimonadaceae bacterium]|nr:2-oxoacid:acceptor oxidoreductase subunit alpha [Capsulimonadaceae bacterium]